MASTPKSRAEARPTAAKEIVRQGLAGCIAEHPLPHLLISPYENTVLFANTAAQRHFGVDPEVFASSKFSDLFEQDSVGHLHVATQQAMNQGFAWTRALRPAGAGDTGFLPDGIAALCACGGTGGLHRGGRY